MVRACVAITSVVGGHCIAVEVDADIGIRVDRVAANRIPVRRRTVNQNAIVPTEYNCVAFVGADAADARASRGVSDANAVHRVATIQCATRVRSDQIAVDGGVHCRVDLDSVASIGRDDIFGTGSRSANDVPVGTGVDLDSIVPVAKSSHAVRSQANDVALHDVVVRILDLNAIVDIARDDITLVRARSANRRAGRACFQPDAVLSIGDGSSTRGVRADQVALNNVVDGRCAL